MPDLKVSHCLADSATRLGEVRLGRWQPGVSSQQGVRDGLGWQAASCRLDSHFTWTLISLPATNGRESCSSEAHARETHDRVTEWGTQGSPRKSCRTWMHGQQEGLLGPALVHPLNAQVRRPERVSLGKPGHLRGQNSVKGAQ